MNSPEKHVLPKQAPRTLRVCVISRSPDVGRTLSRLLTVLGHEATAVFDGQEGVQLVLDKEPDVVITCMDLPTLDGFQVASKIRDRLPNRPVLIAHTSYSIDTIRWRAKDAGFDLIFAKPASVEKLQKGLAFFDDPEACREWRV